MARKGAKDRKVPAADEAAGAAWVVVCAKALSMSVSNYFKMALLLI